LFQSCRTVRLVTAIKAGSNPVFRHTVGRSFDAGVTIGLEPLAIGGEDDNCVRGPVRPGFTGVDRHGGMPLRSLERGGCGLDYIAVKVTSGLFENPRRGLSSDGAIVAVELVEAAIDAAERVKIDMRATPDRGWRAPRVT